MRSFADWNDRKARGWTGFKLNQLQEIATQFDLVHGQVRVQNYEIHHYLFTCQELFLFGTVKLYSGLDNTQLSDCIFCGCSRQWSTGFKWFLNYVDDRYRHVVSMGGLTREVHNFPRYA